MNFIYSTLIDLSLDHYYSAIGNTVVTDEGDVTHNSFEMYRKCIQG